ncbi:TAXI family TRAP transporter solute-binding subunit [Afifella sp. JA880]|uniref:TAXI family TRAP transporter solute-binding subunit n=1 Tax=Afifella sp. JA880 TaxID=2975280 RepID=UPI0021BB70AD|nr:TAXI family TRAP transporter solute-binding subunit [Afifella sp. JA880]MCT8267148.1 TAXI family TRAP transporter solute-binding subunit [Afifella sp. JA880]
MRNRAGWRVWAAGGALIAAAVIAGGAQAETRITYKSAKAGTSYYQMGVELSEAIKQGTDGDVILTVEESQGSVQNVMEAAVRPGSFIFTTPPALVGLAQAGKGAFEKRPSEKFKDVRALFPIPSLTMHFVIAGDEAVLPLSALEGKSVLLGKGSFGAREGEKYLELFDLKDKVTIANAELGNAADALKNGQIDAFVTSGSFPAPNVVETAASADIGLVSMTDEEVEKTGRTRAVIPAGTYAGVDEDVVTTSLPVIAYTTTAMDADTAYLVTKTFWEEKARLSETAPWWKAVSPELLSEIEGKLHEGALRYYEEAGIDVPEQLK